MQGFRMWLEDEIEEDSAVPANCAGAGQVAAIGVGPQGEPGLSPRWKKRILLAKKLLKRKRAS